MPTRTVLLLLLAIAVGVAAWRAADIRRPSPSRPGGSRVARVLRVVDGDTIVVRGDDGAPERVRYIGMDTPESVKPGTPVQCYAEAASAVNRGLVAGRTVRLVSDEQRTDRYGRTLAYVYRMPDGLFVNAELVRRGLARTLEIPPDVRFSRRLEGLAERARHARLGLWSAC